MDRLGEKEVGSIVKLNVDGTATEFLIVQQGNPDASLYDDSCNGTWLLMKDIYTTSAFDSSQKNSYKASTVHTYLNGTFFELMDADIQNAVQEVKIPYCNGTGYSNNIATGSNGLSTKVFLLSGYEVGCTTSNESALTQDGVRLAYFLNGTAMDSARTKRKAYYNGSLTDWWLRSPSTDTSYSAFYGMQSGYIDTANCTKVYGVRPALILPTTLLVSDDGTVIVNIAPTVTTSTAELGEKNAAFAWEYTVADEDGESLTVTEKLDGNITKTRTGVASGTTLTFEQTIDASGFQKILNGSHTITVDVSDGKEAVSASATFTKAVYSASITLTEPLAVAGDIEVAILTVGGNIPADATFKVEVTNNGNDSSPVWQDCTAEVKAGENIVFDNKTAVNGAAFNFRVTVSRGASGTGGYILSVSGAFQ